jgi:hypothetical protein
MTRATGVEQLQMLYMSSSPRCFGKGKQCKAVCGMQYLAVKSYDTSSRWISLLHC